MKNRLVINVIKDMLHDFKYCFKNFISKYFKTIFKILMFCLICINCYYADTFLQLIIINLIIILIFDFIFCTYNKVLQKKMQEEYKIPVLKRKLTKVKDNGDVEMSKADLNIAVIYLNQIENYIEKHGHKYLILLLLLMCLKGTTVNACELTEDERTLLQQTAIAEAGNQGVGGMAFVMQTIINRVESVDFPNSVQEVVYQDGQFDVANQNLKNIKITNNSRTALKYMDILQNRGQLYFEYNKYSNTWQSNNLEYLFTHLDHDFYK